MKRVVADLSQQASDADVEIAAAREALGWKLLLLKVASSPAILGDRQLAAERERHHLFHEKNLVKLAEKIFEYPYPERDLEKRQIIEPYVKQSADPQLFA